MDRTNDAQYNIMNKLVSDGHRYEYHDLKRLNTNLQVNYVDKIHHNDISMLKKTKQHVRHGTIDISDA